MRVHTTTITTERRRGARCRVIALVLGVCALVIPATATAQLIDGDHKSAAMARMSPAEPPVAQFQPAQVADYSSVTAIPPAMDEPTVVSDSPSNPADGFDPGDAALGAGAAMALVALGGAVLFTVRRRPGVSPSASTG